MRANVRAVCPVRSFSYATCSDLLWSVVVGRRMKHGLLKGRFDVSVLVRNIWWVPVVSAVLWMLHEK